MKFIKNNLKVIIGFIIGMILSGGIVYAITSANQVIYTTDKNAEIKTVADALNDLYNRQPFIWTNQEHSSLDAQTILCDTSKYKHALVLLEYANNNRYTGLTSIYTFDIILNNTETISAVNGDSNITASRTIKFKEDGIEISLASYSGSLSGTNDSGVAIIKSIVLY